jgi:hypothetical protein
MERERLTRMRWRMRGAWLWPTFVAVTLLEGLTLHLLPVAGDGSGFVPATLQAGFLNLVMVAVVAPIAGARLRRRRPDLPKVVADNHAGTALVLGVFVALLAGGLLHRPEIVELERARVAQSGAVHGYVNAQAEPEYRRNLAAADTWRIEPELFRTCVPGDDAKRPLCLLVDTSQSPPGVEVDPDRQPNKRYFGR